jgi:hypothetical protein
MADDDSVKSYETALGRIAKKTSSLVNQKQTSTMLHRVLVV